MHLNRRVVLTGLALVAFPAAAQQLQTIRIGATPGPHAQILKAVRPNAIKRGLDLKIIEFSDYVVPNAALASGEIEANSFQHQPYLDNQNKDRGFKLVSVAQTVTFPMGIYSKRHKSWNEVPNGGMVAIQNDPTNGGRARLLLQSKGVIKVKESAGLKPTVADITENPKKLKFVEIDAAQAPRVLDDVDAAAINTNYAQEAGLNPTKDPILKEDPSGPYVNVIAVRESDRDKPWVQALVEAYRSPETKRYIEEKFGGAVLPSW